MTHVGDLLSAFVDAQLDAGERSSVEAHLAGCSECRAELTAVSEIRDRLRALPVVEAPPATFDLVAEVVPIHRNRRRSLVAAAAVATLVVGIGFGVNGNQTVPLELNQVVEQHVARASVDPGLNVLQVQAVANR